MPTIKCRCGRDFSGYQYYKQHIEANEYCLSAIRPDGTRHPKYARGTGTAGRGAGDVIRDAANLLEEEEKKQLEDRVFEFEDDEGPPSKRIRVGVLTSSARSSHGGGKENRRDDFPFEEDSVACNVPSEKCMSDSESSVLHSEKGNIDEEGKLDENMSNLEDGSNESTFDAHKSYLEGDDTADNVDEVPITRTPSIGKEVKAKAEHTRTKASKEQFEDYEKEGKKDFGAFTEKWIAAIELMDLMNQHGGSLELYKAIFEWHVNNLKATVTVCPKMLHKRLIKRHNMETLLPCELSVYLPHAKETVPMPCHDIKAMTMDLLTDPRLTDEDYLFFDDDPGAPMPENSDTIGDVNTGRSYRATYKKLIEPEPMTPCGRIKVLTPYIFYLDACCTGQYNNLSIEILKFSLGILNGECRKKVWAWKFAGYVKKILKKSNLAQKSFRESQHVDANEHVTDPSDRKYVALQEVGPEVDQDWQRHNRNGQSTKKEVPEVKPQDLHAMLQATLESHKTTEDQGGIEWDLRYKGKTQPVLLMPFIVFLKVDSAEADKLCGQCGPKTEKIKSICRYCCVRTEDTDKPYLQPDPAMKTQEMTQGLVSEVACQSRVSKKTYDESVQKLKDISQHQIWNCWYRHRFGLHNKMGIHGASPWEPLHHIQLGAYKYLKQALFLQLGESSKLGHQFDALCEANGQLLHRQSDRNLPRTTFTDGIREGKLQAHEMTGVMTLILVTIRSTAGRNLLMNAKNSAKQREFLGDENSMRDWIRVLEYHLMFEEFSKQKEMKVHHLERAKIKIRELMALTKHTAKRTKGMGHNTVNYHAFIHLPQIYLDLAAAMYLNTQDNEHHHIPTKGVADRTNKHTETFDISHSRKTIEIESVTRASLELQGGRLRWKYHRKPASAPLPEPMHFSPTPRGPWTHNNYDTLEKSWKIKVMTSMKGKEKYCYDANTAAHIESLAEDLRLACGVQSLVTFGWLQVFSATEKNHTQHYYAKPHSKGRPMQNWALFNLSDPDSEYPNARKCVPAHIKCFLYCNSLPDNEVLGPPGLYAIIEPAYRNSSADEQRWSDLITAWVKKPCTVPGYENHNRQEVVNVDRLTGPCIMVPDIEHANKRAYLKLNARRHWGMQFQDWLELEHTRQYE